jgi:hypothetical protein
LTQEQLAEVLLHEGWFLVDEEDTGACVVFVGVLGRYELRYATIVDGFLKKVGNDSLLVDDIHEDEKPREENQMIK